MSKVLEVKKSSKSQAGPEPWPSSLYARPRVPAMPALPAAPDGVLVAEEILEGCRGAVQQLGVDSISSLGVTSTLRGEGRSTVALGIALALAECGADTVLVEMDIVQPQLAQRLSVSRFPGLGDLAEGRVDLAQTMQPIAPNLRVITAGQIGGSIPHALSQLARNDVLAEIVATGNVVVADLPPLFGNSMGRQAAGLVSDLVLVVRAGVTPVRRIEEAIAGLEASPKVLLNGTRTRVPSWAARLTGI